MGRKQIGFKYQWISITKIAITASLSLKRCKTTILRKANGHWKKIFGCQSAWRYMERNNWALIAKCVPNRTDVQCRERYWNILDPRINHLEWSSEEDERMKVAYRLNPDKWSMIATSVGSRTDNQWRRRWTLLSGAKSKKSKKIKSSSIKSKGKSKQKESKNNEEKRGSPKKKREKKSLRKINNEEKTCSKNKKNNTIKNIVQELKEINWEGIFFKPSNNI